MKNKKYFPWIIWGLVFLLGMAYLFFVLNTQMRPLQKRIILFALLFFSEIYLWIRTTQSYNILDSNFLKGKMRKFIEWLFAFLYWLPLIFVFFMMSVLAEKTIIDLNKMLYINIIGYCMMLYLIKFVAFGILVFTEGVVSLLNLVRKRKISLVCYRKCALLIALVVCGLIWGTATGSMIWGCDNFRIKSLNLAILPEKVESDSIKAVLISDLHLSTWRSPNHVQKMVNLVNEQHPDIIFITGDIVHFCSNEIPDYMPILKKMQAKYGIYSVLGNHDYGRYARFDSDSARIADIHKNIDYQRQLGWHVLLDQNEKIHLNGTDKPITIAGIEFWSPGQLFINEGNIEKTYRGISDSDFVILLSHNPEVWATVRDENLPANLILSGHTHGMQLGLYYDNVRLSPAKYVYKQWGGLYTDPAFLDKYLYVNVGLASVGFPARIGMPPEITVIHLLHQ